MAENEGLVLDDRLQQSNQKQQQSVHALLWFFITMAQYESRVPQDLGNMICCIHQVPSFAISGLSSRSLVVVCSRNIMTIQRQLLI